MEACARCRERPAEEGNRLVFGRRGKGSTPMDERFCDGCAYHVELQILRSFSAKAKQEIRKRGKKRRLNEKGLALLTSIRAER